MTKSDIQTGTDLIDELDEIEHAATELMDELKFADALGLRQRHLELARRIYGDSDAHTLYSFNELGEAHCTLGDYASATATFRQALSLCEAGHAPDGNSSALVRQSLGNMLSYEGLHAEAEMYLRQALGIRVHLFGEAHHETATVMHDLGLALMRADSYDDAESCFRKALAIFEDSPDSSADLTATATHSLGHLLYLKGEHEPAKALLEEALSTREALYGSTHLNTAMSAGMLADVLSDEGDFKAAEANYLRALSTEQRYLPATHPMLLHRLFCYADLLERKDSTTDDEAAIAIYRQLMRVYQASVATSLTAAHVGRHLARLLNNHSEFDEAEDHLLQTLEIYRAQSAPDADYIAVAQSLLDCIRGNRAENHRPQ